MRTPSVYGDFEQPHLRHEMAALVAHDTVWYAAARADPKAHLPRYYEYIGRDHRRNHESQMTSQLRASLEARAAAFLQEAEASHLTWNATTWTRPRHLLGLLCAEDRRHWMAAELLKVLGAEQQLRARLPAGSWPQPCSPVDRLLLDRLQAYKADGSLEPEVRLWGLQRPSGIAELLVLAVEPMGDTKTSPVLTAARTPLIFEQMCNWLFVGFAHNLALESMVSRLAMLEKRHPRTHALTLDATFNYHMHENQLQGRLDRHRPCMRSSAGGALRQRARDRAGDEKPIAGGANRSKAQQQALSSDALQRAREYSNGRLFKKGPLGVAQLAKKARREYAASKRSLSIVKVGSRGLTLVAVCTLALTPTLATTSTLTPTPTSTPRGFVGPFSPPDRNRRTP